ncbi:hypothetical protein PT974_07355 [Cladobotryum mycophilum]|uniref:Uncharacterized protein n=1 Tax=Cladobotryum mycophilum TaxID=491253 RepID=A0ABR0SPU5_9HYPO
MSNAVFYFAMACGIIGSFCIMFCPCGIAIYITHRIERRRERREAAERARRLAAIQHLMSLGQSEEEAIANVDGHRIESTDPDIPAVPPNTPIQSPVRCPTPLVFPESINISVPSPVRIPSPIRSHSPVDMPELPPVPNNTPVNSPPRNYLGHQRSRHRAYCLDQYQQFHYQPPHESRREQRQEQRRQQRREEPPQEYPLQHYGPHNPLERDSTPEGWI